MKKITIAIDGFSSCGKSTLARHLAAALGYTYVDTGAMYRAVTLFALRQQLFNSDDTIDLAALRRCLPQVAITFAPPAAAGHADTCLNGENVEREIRDRAVTARVSRIAAIPFVREAMVVLQRAMEKDKGIVMDGRDIGTTVFPQAELKIFVTATETVRAQRRYDELVRKGLPADYDDILNNLRERDYRDTHRAASPLRQAPTALLLDNSAMTIAEQDLWALQQAQAIINA